MSDAAEVINTVLNEDGRYIPKSIERDERTSRGLIPKLMRMVGRIPFADRAGHGAWPGGHACERNAQGRCPAHIACAGAGERRLEI